MMKKFILAMSVTSIIAATGSAFAADIGVSINIAQPGMYGRIDIGSVPGPQVVYSRPTMIYAAPVGVVREPMYLYVPLGHQKNWRKYCGNYNACGQPVYFVQERWYRDVYVPRYREHEHGRDYRDDRRDYDRDHDRGHGKGRDEDHRDDHGRGRRDN